MIAKINTHKIIVTYINVKRYDDKIFLKRESSDIFYRDMFFKSLFRFNTNTKKIEKSVSVNNVT